MALMAGIAGPLCANGCAVRYHFTHQPINNKPTTTAKNRCSWLVKNFTP
jgi:hypothetical protein